MRVRWQATELSPSGRSSWSMFRRLLRRLRRGCRVGGLCVPPGGQLVPLGGLRVPLGGLRVPTRSHCPFMPWRWPQGWAPCTGARPAGTLRHGGLSALGRRGPRGSVARRFPALAMCTSWGRKGVCSVGAQHSEEPRQEQRTGGRSGADAKRWRQVSEWEKPRAGSGPDPSEARPEAELGFREPAWPRRWRGSVVWKIGSGKECRLQSCVNLSMAVAGQGLVYLYVEVRVSCLQ